MNVHFSDDDEEKKVNKKQRALEIIDKRRLQLKFVFAVKIVTKESLVIGGELAKTGVRHEQQDADEYIICMLDKAVEQQKR